MSEPLNPTNVNETAADPTVDIPASGATQDFKPSPTHDPLSPGGKGAGGEGVSSNIRVPGYKMLGVLGRGGMGVVYKAIQEKANRPVALKMILAGSHADQADRLRFKAEAEAAAKLSHPNIVQLYEVGETPEGFPYFSQEFVAGGTLADRLKQAPLRLDEAAALVESLARAMQYAHERGIVHRDLKPLNILLDGGRAPGAVSETTTKDRATKTINPPEQSTSRSSASVTAELSRPLLPKISDFGLAKQLDSDDGQTRTGAIMGSPAYMAPEQAFGQSKHVGPAADIYALGAILYECLTDRQPFKGATIADTLEQVRTMEPIRLRAFVKEIPRDLETICLHCLHKDPQRRYASGEALADDLRRYCEGKPIMVRPVGTPERAWRWCRRNPIVASLTTAVLLFLVATAGVSLWSAKTLAGKNIIIQKEKDEATGARLLADDKRDEARKQATLALNTIQTLLDKVLTQIGDTPNTLKLKKELIETALEGAAKVTETDQSTSREATILSGHQKLGELFQQSGETEKAYREFAWVNEGARNRVKSKEGTDAARYNLALSCVTMADLAREFKRDMPACRQYIEEAIALCDDILAHPKLGLGALPAFQVRFRLTEGHNRMAVHFVRLGDPAAALEQFRRCHELLSLVAREIDDPAQLDPLDDEQKKRAMAEAAGIRIGLSQFDATALMGMGSMSFRLGNKEAADSYFGQSLGIREQILADKPGDPAATWNLARVCGAIGDFHLQARNLAAAQSFSQRSLDLVRQISDADPLRADYRRDLGVAYYRQGLVMLRQGTVGAAKEQFEKCRELRQKVAAGDKATLRQKLDWQLALAHCGNHVAVAQFMAALEKEPTVDVELLVKVAAAYAVCSATGDDPVLANDFCDGRNRSSTPEC